MTRARRQPCTQERDVLDLVAIGQWPGRADGALRAHVEACASCAEVAAVAAAVREWADDGPVAHVPDASVVWYRAQVRAREDAARRATRPVLLAQLLAVATVVFALVTIGPDAGWYLSLVPDVVMPAVTMPDVTLPDLSRWSWLGWAALGAVGLWLVAGGLAWVLAED